LFAGILLFLLPFGSTAQVTVSGMFSDGMVLQQNTDISIWGWANVGDTIAVTGSWNNKTVKVATDANKKWLLKLNTPIAKTDGTSYTITIKGSNTITLKDILIGEVWLLSGQSNMEMSLEGWQPDGQVEGSAQAIASANYPKIRLLIVGKKSSATPQANITKNWTNGSWTTCSPASVKSFSAAGYFFGKELHTQLNIPIGLVQSAWGGSSCETWANPASLNFVADFRNKGPWTPSKTDDNHTATVLYNGMIAPLVPFTFAGACWYQGETNVGRSQQLTELFPAMIEGWRKDFQRNDLPFYFVQLAPYNGYGGSLPDTWEAQAYVQKLKNTGMAGTLDAGDATNIHPAKKEPVGHRLALLALAKNYGKTSLVFSGPQYQSMQVEGNKIRIKFDHTGTGLKAANNAPTQFEIAGDNLVFSPAKTQIDGHTLLVWNDQISTPKHVRYAWADAATASLFNSEDLPATPFRTNTPAYIQPVKINMLVGAEFIQKGESVTFDWITMGASEVSLNGKSIPESGSMLLKPDSVTNYTIIAKSGSSSATKNFTINVLPDGLYHWSLNKITSASSVYPGSSAASAFDGNPESFWKSNYSNNQWISLDLGEKIPVERVLLNWADSYGKAYQLQVSDDAKTWTTVFTEANGNGQIDFISLANVSTRYIRMFGVTMGTTSGFALKEFEVYSPQKPISGALKDKNGNAMRGTPMVLGKSLTQSVAFAQNIENWKTIQNNGFNTIRVCWVDPYYADRAKSCWSVAEVLPYLDKCVENATATGMNLIINYHNVGAQQNYDKTYQFALENEFWTAVAPRYKNNDLVYYEPANEPTFTMSDYLKPEFKTNYLKLYNILRTLAPERQILFFSFNGITQEIINVVNDYSPQIDWAYTTVAYHMYNSTTSAHIRTVMAYHPVICTEWFYDHLSKLPGNEFIKRVDGFKLNAQTLEKMSSGWIDWRDWGDFTLNETVDTLITDARVKNYWWGKPVAGIKATGIGISDKKNELISGKTKKLEAMVYPALAENQQIIWTSSNTNLASVSETGLVTAVSSRDATATITAKAADGGFTASCEVLIRASEAKVAYPEGNPHQLPGTINPTHFDHGGEGVGYHDLTPTNDGDGIRKEQGVDTEYRLPEGTVGGIAHKEWLEYTVEILQDGNYTFEILFATAGRYGKFHIEFDGVDKTGLVSVPTTGSYTKFASRTISGIELKKGIQVMRIYFDYAEYNLGMISISREIPSGIARKGAIPKPTVHPSPTRDKLYLSGVETFFRYSILNVYGQVLKQGSTFENPILDVRFLCAGNYLIRFESNHDFQTEKFIKL
jgi:sialate O-acetylesterase